MEIVRYDFQESSTGLLIQEWYEGWEPGTPPDNQRTNPAAELSTVLLWLNNHGWDVVSWPGGARAWKGERRPVRTRAQILRKREDLRRMWNWYRSQGIQTHSVDLAFEL